MFSDRFQVLRDIEDPEEEHDQLIKVYREAAKKTMGISKKQSKPWIRDETWRRVDEREALKIKLEGSRSERLKERLSGEYRTKDREGEKKCTRGQAELDRRTSK